MSKSLAAFKSSLFASGLSSSVIFLPIQPPNSFPMYPPTIIPNGPSATPIAVPIAAPAVLPTASPISFCFASSASALVIKPSATC